jgi:formylglycine-generating enzyme required for sulfatase activity
VLRGGSWDLDVNDVRSAYRNFGDPDHWYLGSGFRCVRSLRS